MAADLALATHEPVRIDAPAITCVREAFAAVLDPHGPARNCDKPLAQVATLARIHEALAACLSAPEDTLREDAYLSREPRATIQSVRGVLSDMLVDKAEILAADAHRCGIWTRLSLGWLVYAQVLVLDDVLRGYGALLAAHGEADREEVSRAELWAFDGGIAAVSRYSMYELRLALHVFRVRLMCAEHAGAGISRYLGALELRAAHFMCGTDDAPATDRDVDEWRARGSSNFVLCMAWWLVVLKRFTGHYRALSLPTMYKEKRGERVGCVVKVPVARGAGERLAAVLVKLARKMFTDDHERAFRELAERHDIPYGDAKMYTALGTGETATLRSILGQQRCGRAAIYVVRTKYKRPLMQWIESLVSRRPPNGVTGGRRDVFTEQLATLHVLNHFFITRLGMTWHTFYLLLATTSLGTHVRGNTRKAQSAGRPFLSLIHI